MLLFPGGGILVITQDVVLEENNIIRRAASLLEQVKVCYRFPFLVVIDIRRRLGRIGPLKFIRIPSVPLIILLLHLARMQFSSVVVILQLGQGEDCTRRSR